MIADIWPETMITFISAYATVETKNEDNYGQVYLDLSSKTPNATICIDINPDLFKKYLFQSLL